MSEITPIGTRRYIWVSGIENTRFLVLLNYWIPFYPACGIERYKCNSTTIYDTSAEIKVASNKAFHLIFLYLEFGKIPNKGILFRASRQSEVLRRIAPLNNPLTKNFHFCVRPLMIFTALGLNACYFFMT